MSSPHAANILDAAALADELGRFRVVDAARLAGLLTQFTGTGSIALAESLVRAGVLTAFQAERALAGESRLLALGPYRLTNTAGRGTFGPMFTATHVSKPGVFAVCVLPLRSLWKAKQAKQLARTLAAGVNHPGVVPLLEADSANGFHYLVWLHSDGPRLTDRVNTSGPLPPGEAAALLGHLANAVAACHARKATHGAITPPAIAIQGSGLPLLLELGSGALLAQNVAEEESLFDTMSSALASANVLTYAAPELAADPDACTPPADQYALGAVGYFAVTGLPPYPHPTLAEQLRAKRNSSPPSASVVNPAVPRELAAVLDRMMSPDPDDRFTSLEEVEQQFAAIAATDPSSEHELISAVPMSELRQARLGPSSGSISWNEDPSETLRPAARDDTDASITFDLPETDPNAPANGAPGGPAHVHVDTPPGFVLFTPLATPPQPEDSEAAVGKVVTRKPGVADETETPRRGADPRLAAPTPVHWHRTRGESTDEESPEGDSRAEGNPPANSVLWKKVKRNLLFWQSASDVVQVSVYCPTATPGQTIKLMVFLHTPDAARSVKTLSRAFLDGAELVGTGYLAREIARGTKLAVHLSVANAGVSKALAGFEWRGQPHRFSFDLHVPWESPEGTSPGLVSVGLSNVRVGKIEFGLSVLARKA